ncbi:S8 family serine peptidase [Iamia sp.]|uniref:S8 family serine peptidase n=1 Tax=Iamia sp. TaxID=2722710 RepID=UPI002C41C94E|nr:S8 family serine peptidase [Iamia sp.]HXH57580.1 S8 family serine peptidase [Iamia sp.]
MAESDADLLARTDTTPVPVMVKLDYDAIASYSGGVRDIPATSPSTTGRSLTTRAATESRYALEVARRETAITDAIAATVPEARIGRSLRVVYGGVTATVPANRARDLLSVPGVVAVHADELRQLLTDSSNEFIGSPAVWDEVGGRATAGEGILFGSLDSGLWPEHPSFADNPDLPAAPPRPDGNALECDYGDNPLTEAVDVHECGNKLVGGRAFIDQYLAQAGLPEETYPDSARDSNGHGTHTATTSAGGVVDEAEVFGIDRGPISGVAPGASVMGYKVCGALGCYTSDTTAAVEAAILDGVDVINYSISGGVDPFADPTELAFLDAYAAGIYVATSAGNSGPTAATANHLSPWVTSVAASTQTREFGSTLTLTADGGATFTAEGVSIGSGLTGDAPVELATEVEGYTDVQCATEPPSDTTFEGLIVGCERGNPAGRVASGYNAFLGGAAGVVLYNPTLADVETDNHWLPVVHLADGTEFTAFMAANDEVTGSFTAGEPRDGAGDVMANFSSRGPAGAFVKPDITAPGVQILAGHTPTPESIVVGPPGEYFQAIAGTSMSAPHVAGSGILLLADHPEWTPGQVRSALMTTSTTDVVKEDLETPADPFDMGAGRIDLAAAKDPGLTLDETARDFLDLTNDPTTSIDLNLPSLNAPLMPGRVTTTRTVTNVSASTATYAVSTSAGDGSAIDVSPSRFTIPAGASKALTITIQSANTDGQEFGEIRLRANGRAPLHLPVAFAPRQGGATVTSDCDPADVEVGATSACTVTATNDGFGPTTVGGTTTVNDRLRVATAGAPAEVTDNRTATLPPTELSGREPGTPSLEPLGVAGYLPLDSFGVAPNPVGDEEALDFDLAEPFLYNGIPYDRIGVTTNGYLIAGGSAGSTDIVCCPPQVLPDIAPPNNVIAPFWSDLTGEGAPGIVVATLTDDETGDSWAVIEWQLNAFGTDERKTFQVWLGMNAAQDVELTYPSDDLPDLTGLSEDLVIGAENENGTGGESRVQTPPTVPDGEESADLAVVSTDPTPGDSLSYTVEVTGYAGGPGEVRTELAATGVPGTTVVTSPVAVIGPALGEVEAFVERAYQDLAGRRADPGGLAYWSDRIRAGTITRAGFALRLARGDHWLGEVVDERYRQIVGFDPDPDGRAFWISHLRAGGSERLLAAQLVGSPAFFDRANREVPAFVDETFLALIGRLPEPAGRDYWIGRVDDGLSRSRVGSIIFSLREVRERRARDLSVLLLRRPPSGGELSSWAAQLRTGTDLNLTATIVGSDAYFDGGG